ncbi:MAG: endo-1,4-beta-xylanase [Ruminococcus sp.]|nr:endo-1,4-beta-xylanase [Ruminococcus sp.]
MKGKKLKRFTAGILGAAMAGTATLQPAAFFPVVAADSTAAKVIFSTDFEDGTFEGFDKRGDDDTTELTITETQSVSGSKALSAAGRTQSWNGPSFRIDKLLEPGKEYMLNASIKAKDYANITFSFQYTDAEGVTHYNNIVKDIQSGGWKKLENIPFSYTADMKDVFIYFETNNTDDLFLDDFSITEAPPAQIENDLKSLARIFGNDFKIGTAVTPEDMASSGFMQVLEKHFFQSITVGNQLKPDYVLNEAATKAYLEETGDDTTPQISFGAAKAVLDYCQKNNIPVRLHTLVWHSQTPEWFFKEDYDASKPYVSKDKMLKRMENYIKAYFTTITKLYPDVNFYACDVVNEAWLDDGTPREPGHPAESNRYMASDWVAVFGDNSFIEYAFKYARQYAPAGCKLYYNDFNEYTGKMQNIYDMAMDLKEKGLIDGIGMQSHLDVRQGQDAYPSVEQYEIALKKYISTGLDVQITELDATVPEYSNDRYFEAQANYYKGLFNLYEKYKDGISAVIFWGINDTKSWRASQQPLIFDENFLAKPAYYSIVEGRDEQVLSTTTTTTNTTTTTTTTTTPPTDPTGLVPYVVGDANCDHEVNMADAVYIMQCIGNPDKYQLTWEGERNADTDLSGDITNMDALCIQKYKLGLINALPMTRSDVVPTPGPVVE